MIIKPDAYDISRPFQLVVMLFAYRPVHDSLAIYLVTRVFPVIVLFRLPCDPSKSGSTSAFFSMCTTAGITSAISATTTAAA